MRHAPLPSKYMPRGDYVFLFPFSHSHSFQNSNLPELFWTQLVTLFRGMCLAAKLVVTCSIFEFTCAISWVLCMNMHFLLWQFVGNQTRCTSSGVHVFGHVQCTYFIPPSVFLRAGVIPRIVLVVILSLLIAYSQLQANNCGS